MIRFITPIPKNSTLKVEEISLVYNRNEAHIDYLISINDEVGAAVLRERRTLPRNVAVAFMLGNLPPPVQLFDLLDQWLQAQIGGTLLGNDDVDISVG